MTVHLDLITAMAFLQNYHQNQFMYCHSHTIEFKSEALKSP